MKTVRSDLLRPIVARYGTPLYVYDADVIRERITSLRQFDIVRFAQKAASNVHLLRLVRSEGVAVDAVSLGEIERALAAGYSGGFDSKQIVFTADVITEDTLACVIAHEILVNAGSIDMLDQLGRRDPGHEVWLRVNPGFGHGHSRKTNTGGEWSKHGIWHEDAREALRVVGKYDLRLVGVHMHIGSGSDFDHLARVCDFMAEFVLGHDLDVSAISGGGGLPIPYRRGEDPFDPGALFRPWHAARRRIEDRLRHGVILETEPGRYLVAESGQMVAEVRATKRVGPNHFALVDAGFGDLVRPAMYGSYHEIDVVKPDGTVASWPTRPTVIGGPLCESGDVFTQEEGGVVVPRELPEITVGDLLVFHDTGAYGATMASNYNSRPLAPEVLIDGGSARLIRRRQTIDDLLELENVEDGS